MLLKLNFKVLYRRIFLVMSNVYYFGDQVSINRSVRAEEELTVVVLCLKPFNQYMSYTFI